MVGKAQTITTYLVGDNKRLTGTLTDTQRRVSQFGMVATAALVAFGVSATKAFAEREMAQEKLNFALQQSPTLMNLNADSMAAFNTELAENVAIDDDVIAGAEAVLARFATTRDELESLTTLSADYARVTGTDIVSAAEAVGKATLGSTRPLKALGIAYTVTGNQAEDAANIQQLLNDKVHGYAEVYAGTAAGKTEELGRQYGELQETIGGALLPAFEGLLAVVTPIVKGFGALPKPVQQLTFGVLLLSAATLAIVPRILAMKAAFAANNITMATTKARATSVAGSLASVGKAAGGPLAVGITAALIPIGAFQEEMARTDALLENWGEGGETRTQAINDELMKMPGVASRIADVFGGDAFTSITRAGTVLGDIGVSVTDVEEATKLSADGFFEWTKTQAAAAEAAGYNGATVDNLWDSLMRVASAESASGEAAHSNAVFTEEAGGAAADTATKMEQLAAMTDKATAAWRRYVGLPLDVADANVEVNAGLVETTKTLRQNNGALDYSTKAGRENISALTGQFRAIDSLHDAVLDETGSRRAATKAYEENRKALLNAADAAGIERDELLKVIGTAGNVPHSVSTWWGFRTDTSRDQVSMQLASSGKGQALLTSALMAGGGSVVGPGGPRDDLVPAWLSNGEFVVNARAARRHQALLMAINAQRYAAGGNVGGGNFNDAQKSDWEKLLTRLGELVDVARSNLSELKGQRRDLAKSVSSGLLGGLSVGAGIREGVDNNAQTLLSRYRQSASRIKRFMRDMSQLQRKGLGRTLTMELLDMGSEEGAPIARMMLAQPNLINRFNRVYGEANRATNRFGRQLGSRVYGNRIDHAQHELAVAEGARDRARRAHGGGTTIHQLHMHFEGLDIRDKKRFVREVAHELRGELRRVDRENGNHNNDRKRNRNRSRN